MGIAFNVAVIMLRNRSTQAPPAVSDVQRYLRDDRFSVARFWRRRHLRLGELPAHGLLRLVRRDPARRHRTAPDASRRARRGARDNGIDLRPYDKVLTVVFGVGLDSGATGDRSGASVNAPDPHHFVAHEVGHVIGFDHTYGIPNAGSDWNGDDVVDLNPVYGDPYCIMSGMTFGRSEPDDRPRREVRLALIERAARRVARRATAVEGVSALRDAARRRACGQGAAPARGSRRGPSHGQPDRRRESRDPRSSCSTPWPSKPNRHRAGVRRVPLAGRRE